VGAPAYSFQQDQDTGMYQPAVGQLALATNGVARMTIDGNGVITVPTPATADNSTTAASTAYVKANLASYAPLASPALTGIPIAPTAALNTNTTQLATTAFVLGQAASTAPVMDGTATVGTGTTYARADHVHPSDTSRLALTGGTLSGTVTAPTFTVSSTSARLTGDATYNHFYMDAANWDLRYNRSNGRLSYLNGSAVELFAVDASGNAGLFGGMTATGNVVSNSGIFGQSDQTLGMYASGTTRITVLGTGGYFWQYDTTNGNLTWMVASTLMWQFRTSDKLSFNQLGTVGGNGAYFNISDAAVKTDIVPATHGLAHIQKLSPKTFKRTIESAQGREELGFVAQDVQQAIPEAVHDIGDKATGETLLAVQLDPIVAALVNAVKELSAEVAALKAKK